MIFQSPWTIALSRGLPQQKKKKYRGFSGPCGRLHFHGACPSQKKKKKSVHYPDPVDDCTFTGPAPAKNKKMHCQVTPSATKKRDWLHFHCTFTPIYCTFTPIFALSLQNIALLLQNLTFSLPHYWSFTANHSTFTPHGTLPNYCTFTLLLVPRKKILFLSSKSCPNDCTFTLLLSPRKKKFSPLVQAVPPWLHFQKPPSAKKIGRPDQVAGKKNKNYCTFMKVWKCNFPRVCCQSLDPSIWTSIMAL